MQDPQLPHHSAGDSDGGRKELELACRLAPQDANAHSAVAAALR